MTAGLVLRTLADYQVFTRYGEDVLLEDIRRRLTCRQCGRRPERLSVWHQQAMVPES